MCGRLACALCSEELRTACAYPQWNPDKKSFCYTEPAYIQGCYKYKPSYNIYPSAVIPILASKEHFLEAKDSPADYVVIPARWGLLPSWSAIENVHGHRTHNARLEAIQSTLYKNELLKDRRCVVLCDGYFEWQSTNKQKQPYYIYQDKVVPDKTDSSHNTELDWTGKPILKLAGIFSQVVDTEGLTRYTCAIITKEADSQLSLLHRRMPIVLETFGDVESWINYNILDYQQSIRFLTQYGNMKARNPNKKYVLKYHPVDKKYINDMSCRTEKCVERINVKRQNTLDNWLSKRKAPSGQ